MAPEDVYRYFRVEARDLLDGLAKGALDLEKGAPPPELIARMLRMAHTLKGAGRVVRQREIADLAHAVEDALAAMRDSDRTPARAQIDDVLRLLDLIGARVAALAPAAAPAAAPGELFPAFRPDVPEMDLLLHGVDDCHRHLAAVRRRVPRLEHARHAADVIQKRLAPSGDLRSLAGEVAEAVGALSRDLSDGAEQIDRALAEVRETAERLRLVPASALFTSLERTARDTAQALGRRVVFEGTGGDVRLDAAVLGVVQGALLQLVRNAVAHGIEAPPDRLAAGKPEEGRVSLGVRRRGHRVVFTCADDGRGVDLEAVRRTAHERGLLPAAADGLGPQDLLRLLLKGGITTAGTVTDSAGRGVGLDVVRAAADRLGGEVAVQTIPGAGTTVEIGVPVSLASFQALLVEAAGVTAAVPLDAVRGCVRVSPDQIVRTAGRRSILHDGASMPLGSLARAITRGTDPGGAVAGLESGRATAVIVAGRSKAAAFLVDRVMGAANVVLRPLPDLAPAAVLVAGVSPDADGSLRPVLDPDALVAEADQNAGEPPAESTRPPILVIDDSLTTRMLEQSILESAGYDVGLASSGEEALERARARPYALFLVDIEMPGMDGFTFIERAAADPALRHVPAILVTSRSSAEDRQRGRDVGAHAYIAKSEFDQGVLLERIRSLVG